MRFASVAEVKNNLSKYLAYARRRKEAIVVTPHGKPCAVIQAISPRDLEALDWGGLASERLRAAWEGDDDALRVACRTQAPRTANAPGTRHDARGTLTDSDVMAGGRDDQRDPARRSGRPAPAPLSRRGRQHTTADSPGRYVPSEEPSWQR